MYYPVAVEIESEEKKYPRGLSGHGSEECWQNPTCFVSCMLTLNLTLCCHLQWAFRWQPTDWPRLTQNNFEEEQRKQTDRTPFCSLLTALTVGREGHRELVIKEIKHFDKDQFEILLNLLSEQNTTSV